MSGQLGLDFDYDDRVPRLASEISVMLLPYLEPGLTRADSKGLAERLAKLAHERLSVFVEPTEKIRCHSCDAETDPKNRARVVVCVRCALEGRTPGSSG